MSVFVKGKKVKLLFVRDISAFHSFAFFLTLLQAAFVLRLTCWFQVSLPALESFSKELESARAPSTRLTMRVLCLHGMGTNADIFRAQTRKPLWQAPLQKRTHPNEIFVHDRVLPSSSPAPFLIQFLRC